jgi:hypothetical protein
MNRSSNTNARIGRGTGYYAGQPAELNDFAKLADAPPVVVADDLLFRWSHIIKIAKIVPGMSAIRALEHQIHTHGCRSCQKPTMIFDRTPLENVRRFLAECSDEIAKTVKQAAGIVKYRVSYRTLAGVPREIVR